MLSKKSKIASSCAKIQDDVPGPDDSMFRNIEEIKNSDVDSAINVRVKIVKLGDVQEVTKDGQILKKRAVSVADNTDVIDVLLWQQSVNDLMLNSSYNMIGIKVKKYMDNIFLSPISSTLVQITEDISEQQILMTYRQHQG